MRITPQSLRLTLRNQRERVVPKTKVTHFENKKYTINSSLSPLLSMHLINKKSEAKKVVADEKETAHTPIRKKGKLWDKSYYGLNLLRLE